jgi:O-acetyl-ADP-ribose deacetylase (regulator of RNase III)
VLLLALEWGQELVLELVMENELTSALVTKIAYPGIGAGVGAGQWLKCVGLEASGRV